MAKTITMEIPTELTVELGRDIGPTTVDLSTCTPATMRGIFEYGAVQVFNDGGSTPNEEETKAAGEGPDAAKAAAAAAVMRRVQSVMKNQHNFGGGGGAKLSPTVRVLREWLVADLTDREVCGDSRLKRADATKIVSASVEKAFGDLMKKSGDEREAAEAWTTYQKAAAKEAGTRAKSGAGRRG